MIWVVRLCEYQTCFAKKMNLWCEQLKAMEQWKDDGGMPDEFADLLYDFIIYGPGIASEVRGGIWKVNAYDPL